MTEIMGKKGSGTNRVEYCPKDWFALAGAGYIGNKCTGTYLQALCTIKKVLKYRGQGMETEPDHTKIRKFLWIAVAVLAVLTLWNYRSSARYKQAITTDYSIGTAQIINYEEHNDVEGSDIYMTYSYVVDGRVYFRRIKTWKISGCIDVNKQLTTACQAKRFLILYSNSEPDKSIINLTSVSKDTLPDIHVDDFH
jgi:hypothetical protein